MGDYVRRNGVIAGLIRGCEMTSVFHAFADITPGGLNAELTGDPRDSTLFLDGVWNYSPNIPANGWRGPRIVSKTQLDQATLDCDWSGTYRTRFGKLEISKSGRFTTGSLHGQQVIATNDMKCRLVGVHSRDGVAWGFSLTRNGTSVSGPFWRLRGEEVVANDLAGVQTSVATPLPVPSTEPDLVDGTIGAELAWRSKHSYRFENPFLLIQADPIPGNYLSNVGIEETAVTSGRSVNSSEWLQIVACDPAKVSAPRIKLTWQSSIVPGSKFFEHETQCRIRLDRLWTHGEEIEVEIHVTGKTPKGATVDGRRTLKITYKPLWIVVIGDSYASGEGAPPVNADHKESRPRVARWMHVGERPEPRLINQPNLHEDRLCHVSPRAWAMKATEKLARHYGALANISNLACSGSLLDTNGDIIKRERPSETRIGKSFNFPDGYKQIGYLENAVRTKGRKPDFIFLSVGINNADFVKVLTKAATERLTFSKLTSDSGRALLLERREEIDKLPSKYQALARRLASLVDDPSRIIMPSYPDFTRNHNGEEQQCVRELKNDLLGFSCDKSVIPNGGFGHDFLASITEEEWDLANRTFADPLLTTQRNAARDNGWTFLAGAQNLFFGRGICNAQRLVNRPCDSVRNQGDFSGSYHPNADGHAAVADFVARAMVNLFDGPLSRRTAQPDAQ